jgi:hypothetical protein
MNFEEEDIDLGFILGKLNNKLARLGKQIEHEDDRSELKRNYIKHFSVLLKQ